MPSLSTTCKWGAQTCTIVFVGNKYFFVHKTDSECFSMSRRWTRVSTIYLLLLLQFRRRQRLRTMMLRRWDSVNEFKKMSKNSSDSENFLNFQVSESDNCSSVATAQIPVPQQRSSIRRNEYVNIPIPQRVSISIRSIRSFLTVFSSIQTNEYVPLIMTSKTYL